ncbi:MAG: hypothetical protein COA67_00395 [Lutibacter sp.]|nr:MAG: hypothetical protein COA67_00395 [Lutibacter sp.]
MKKLLLASFLFYAGSIFSQEITINLNNMPRAIEETLEKGEYILNVEGEFETDKYYINYSQGITSSLIDPLQTKISKENDSTIIINSLPPQKDQFEKKFYISMGNRSKFELSIHVIQKENDSIIQKHKIIYKSKAKRKWVTSLGVSSNFIKSNTYRSLKQDDDTYKIVKDGNNQKLQVIPLMQFSFINLEKDNDFCLTGGIGFDTENISVFAGGSYYVGQNIFLTAGVSLHKQKQLNNLYNENQILTEAVDESIINKDYYRINPFISFTYRLSSNVFKK